MFIRISVVEQVYKSCLLFMTLAVPADCVHAGECVGHSFDVRFGWRVEVTGPPGQTFPYFKPQSVVSQAEAFSSPEKPLGFFDFAVARSTDSLLHDPTYGSAYPP